MIIDGHAYCFPPLGEANGFPTAQEHLRYLQREMADHHQPVWRLRDRALGDNKMLADPQDDTLRGLKEVDFRAGGYGRFVWTVEGEEYAKQYLPPYLTDLSHSPEMLVAQMDYVGISRAVLHAHPIMGFLNDYLADCVRCYPERLLALANIPEWKIERDPEGAVAEVERAYAKGLHGLQFSVHNRYRYGVTESWNASACRPFWDGVTVLGKPIFFTICAPCPGSTVEDYLSQLQVWQGWLTRYPDTLAVLTHGFPWRLFLSSSPNPHQVRTSAGKGGADGLRLPDALFEPFRASNAILELLFQISLGNVWDYPYTELHPTIVQLVEKIGSERLMWGTDMPNVERFCTYRQNLETFRVHCKGLISDEDIDNILGGTAARLFNIGN